MSSRREVLIRILALLQKKPLIKSKKSHIKMLKTALFDCAINKKCCSVDGGRGICPLFSSPPRGIWQLKSPHPREFANAQGSAPGGGWAQVELTDALIVSIWTHSICQMQATFLGVELELERLGV